MSALKHLLAGRAVEPIAIGCSRALVARVEGGHVLKSSSDVELIRRERDRLEALQALTRVPSVIAYEEDDQGAHLLMTELPGRDASVVPESSRERVLGEIVDALARLHATPATHFRWQPTPDDLIAEARRHLALGLVDLTDFEEPNRGRDPERMLDELETMKPSRWEPVLTHGDACLPNFLFDGETFTGFVDVGRAALSDRHADVALTARSLRQWGAPWGDRFLARCGDVDPKRIEFFVLLDEFF